MPGTQIDPRRGTLYADPDALIKEFAGKGRVVTGSKPGGGGTRESSDTGSRIMDVYRHKDGREALTTRGMIHYSSRGAHIVPARPSGWVE
ncbi:polymorphic toxin type 50 domain-containing protein [Pseudoroseomonas ludipueritiae]|uniref:Bacterial toxin 50 domain-containing protein n=1 Tax=Pseudoroseomonas ludipueritiae TaxID=198093 RepID=A0ABR7R3M5_9PROT|nr:hypothetical protein [Pseudoroseomonas ludipueritiae]